MVEVRENRALFLDGGYEVQGNLIIILFFLISFSPLRVKLRKRGRSLEMSHPFCARMGVLAVVLSAIT